MEQKIYCVTGASGYLGSWLVKTLLERGHTIHATLRDPEDPKKAGPLKSLEGAAERLKLFKADLLEQCSFDKAVEGCNGVFHLASPVVLSGSCNSEEELVFPAVEGCLNVLKSCIQSKTVKKVVVTSSMAAVYPMNDKGELIGDVNETRWTSAEFFRQSQDPIRFYIISKILAEQAALKFGEEHADHIQVMTIVLGQTCGPFITAELPETCAMLLSFFTGDEGMNNLLKIGQQVFGYVPLVHTQDACDAHIFVMENPSAQAQGCFICCGVPVPLSQLSEFLASRYPDLPLKFRAGNEDQIARNTSRKLIDMGFVYKHGLESTVEDCLTAAVSHGAIQFQKASHSNPSKH